MAIEPVFEKITCTKENKIVKERVKVECRTEIESSEVKKIINLSASGDIVSAEIHNGKILYKGKVIYFVCYEDVEGDIRKAEYGCEFNGEAEVPCEVMDYRIDASVVVEKTDVNLSSPKFCATSYVLLSLGVKCCGQVEALTGGNGLISNGENIETLESLGVRETSYEIEEEFEISTEVKEVINHKAEAIITSCLSGVGCIIVDGEAYLSLLLLKDGETKEIIKEQRAFPFRVEIESEEAMPANQAVASVKVVDFKTDIAVSGGEGRSFAEAKLKLRFTAEAFDARAHNISVDAFNIEENVAFEKTEACIETPCDCRTLSQGISGVANVEEIGENARICATTGEYVEIATVSQTENEVTVSGILSLNTLLKDTDGRFFSRKSQIPFEVKLDAPCAVKINRLQTVVRSSTAKIISAQELEIQAELIFLLNCSEEKKFTVINGVTPCGKKQCENSAISIYLASENESLWDLAKRLNVCPEELLNSNKELQFPLTGEERIVVFRQK